MSSIDTSNTNWSKLGGIAGIISMFIYYSAAFGLVPGGFRVVYPVFWLFGPWMVLFAVGQYHFWLDRQGRSIPLDLGGLFWILAGFAVTFVGTFQGVAREFFGLTTSMSFAEGTSEAVRKGFSGANAIQSGADLTWDIYIFIAFAAFGVVMLKDRLVWKVLGGLGVALGVLGLVFNFIAWPSNPGVAGLIDVGPMAGIWGLIVAILMLVDTRKSAHESVEPT